MSRKKKTRSLRGKLSIKTGSKKDFFKPGQKGKIPSQNKLAKHRHRSLSAYQKHLLEHGLTDTSGHADRPDFSDVVTEQKGGAPAPRPEIGKQAKRAEQANPSARTEQPENVGKRKSAPAEKPSPEQPSQSFDDLTGDDLWDLLDKD